MERTKSLKLTKITLSGFRCHKENTVINADDMTLISGDNGKGKSSIAHAVTYALFGVSAYGVQDIDNIRNTDKDTVSVTLDFIDQNGELHSLNRTRRNADTMLSLDGNTILQKQIDSLFCDKDLFLSMFNPSYFIEVLGGKAKDLLELRLPVIKKDAVLEKLTKTEQELLKDIDLTVPEIALQNLRRENKELGEEALTVDGRIASISDDLLKGKAKKTECLKEISELEQKIAALTAVKNEGISNDDLNTEKLLIQQKLKQNCESSKSNEVSNLAMKLTEIKSRVYISENAQDIADLSAELKTLSKQHYEVKERVQNVKPGDVCPTCYISISESNVDSVKQNLAESLKQITEMGKSVKINLYAKTEANQKAQAEFEEKREKDAQEIRNRYEELKLSMEDLNHNLISRLDKINDMINKGNLTDEEYNNLIILEMELKSHNSLLHALDIEGKEAKYKELLVRKTEIVEKTTFNLELIKAVQEFTAKRSEMALSVLIMPNVRIKFYEIIRTTGELKNCFKFTYKGYEYSTLSLAEKIKAGIEIAYMLRNLTGYNYPIFIDNSESIGDFDSSLLPAQSFFMRFTKGAGFTVKARQIPKETKEEQKAA